MHLRYLAHMKRMLVIGVLVAVCLVVAVRAYSGWTDLTDDVYTNKSVIVKDTSAPNTTKWLRMLSSGQPNFWVTPSGSSVNGGGGGRLPLPRSTAVEVDQQYVTAPPLENFYKVVTAGTTAATQPIGFPIPRYFKQLLRLNGRIVQGMRGANPNWYYDITSVTGGVCAPECSNAGTSCSAHGTCSGCSNGCSCTTSSTALPTGSCWSSPSENCTVSDSSCNYTAHAFSGLPNVTDGTAVLAWQAFEAAHGAPGVYVGDAVLDHANTAVYSGDNQVHPFEIGSAYDYNLPRSDPGYGVSPFISMGVFGDSRLGIPQVAISQNNNPTLSILQSSFARGYTGSADAEGSPPGLPPSVTLQSGGSLPIGSTYCFVQGFMSRSTGGANPAGPSTCVTTTSGSRSILIKAQLLGGDVSSYEYGYPLVVIWQDLVNRLEERTILDIANFDTNTLNVNGDSILIDNDDDFAEMAVAYPNAYGGDPILMVNGSNSIFSTWAASTAMKVEQRVLPANPFNQTPPVPFEYSILGGGCDGNCRNCSIFTSGKSVTTGTTAPTWRTDARPFCDNSGVRYQRVNWDGLRVAAVNSSIYDDGNKESEFGIFNVGAKGYQLLSRTFRGRTQLLCLDPSIAKPTCDASKRGLVWVTCGGTGVADLWELCEKDGVDNYAWQAEDFTIKPVARLGGAEMTNDFVYGGEDTSTTSHKCAANGGNANVCRGGTCSGTYPNGTCTINAVQSAIGSQPGTAATPSVVLNIRTYTQTAGTVTITGGNGQMLVVRASSSINITGGTISVDGLGLAGGAGAACNANAIGKPGGTSVANGGTGGTVGGAGGTGVTPGGNVYGFATINLIGAGGSSQNAFGGSLQAFWGPALAGTGGGSGGCNTGCSVANGNAGAGGGGIQLETRGTLTCSGATLTAAGQAGGVHSGGGGGGSIRLVGKTVSNSCTPNVNGGPGGLGTGGCGAGGAGGPGIVITESGAPL